MDYSAFLVSDRGDVRDIIYEKSWSTKEEATSDLQKIAIPSPYILDKWIGEKDYQEAWVIYRETEIKPPFDKNMLEELLNNIEKT